MKYVIPCILVLLRSCHQKQEHKPVIEIYELNRRIVSFETVPIDTINRNNFLRSGMDTTGYRFSENLNMLLINGAFKATDKELLVVDPNFYVKLERS